MANTDQCVRSTDWLPSPSSTPTTFRESKTPHTETIPHSHFLDAWATPQVNGQHTPVQTPSFTLSTPSNRPLSSYNQKRLTPEDREFFVNHFAPSALHLPPVEPQRRLSSTPNSTSVDTTGGSLVESQVPQPHPLSMDFSQIHTPPPTRDATSSRGKQHNSGDDCSTPATVIRRTDKPMPALEGLFNQTPYGLSNVPFTQDLLQFTGSGSLSTPQMSHTNSFWEQQHHNTHMDIDVPFGVDPFGPTPFKTEANLNWQKFHTPSLAHSSSQALQHSTGVSTSDPATSYATSNAGNNTNSITNSFMSMSASVDPSVLFSFSNPDMTTSFGSMPPANNAVGNRQPYETQMQDFLREQRLVKKARSRHSRSNTNSSSGSNEAAQPRLRRNNIEGNFGMKRSSSMDSRLSGSVTGYTIPRHWSPLKRQGSGSLKAIPELRRPRTRLVVDEMGHARTETVHTEEEDEKTPRVAQKVSRKDLRQLYPGLWEEGDTDSEDDEPAPAISRQASFNVPQPHRRSSKYARVDSVALERSNSYQMSHPSKLSSGTSDRSSFQTARHTKKPVGYSSRSFSMVDLPTSLGNSRDRTDQSILDSPGDALGALKKVVAGRQQKRGMLC